MTKTVVLVFMPADGEEDSIQRLLNCANDHVVVAIKDGQKSCFALDAQIGGDGPDMLFAPDDQWAVGNQLKTTLRQVLAPAERICVAIHQGTPLSYGPVQIQRHVESIAAGKPFRLEFHQFSRTVGDAVYEALKALAQCVVQNGGRDYSASLQAIIDACTTDWELEAKLTVLHKCLVPVPEGARGLADDTLSTAFLEEEGLGVYCDFWTEPLHECNPELEGMNAAYSTYVKKTVQRHVIELRQPNAFGGNPDEYRTALCALRDALLTEK